MATDSVGESWSMSVILLDGGRMTQIRPAATGQAASIRDNLKRICLQSARLKSARS